MRCVPLLCLSTSLLLAATAASAQLPADQGEDFVGSNCPETVLVDGCDTGVPGALPDGNCLQDDVDDCAMVADDHAEYATCLATLAGNLPDEQFAAILTCAACAADGGWPSEKANFSCCEANIRLNPDKKEQPKLKALKINFFKVAHVRKNLVLTVRVDFPILFDCNPANNSCVGSFNVEVAGEPRQGGARPPISNLTVIHFPKKDKRCNGSQNNKRTVSVYYGAVYANASDITGTLRLDISVPPNKGNIKHTWWADIRTKKGKVDKKRLDSGFEPRTN